MLFMLLCYNNEAQIMGWTQEEDDAVMGRLTVVHDRLVAEAASRLTGIDIVVLGQFSLARAKPAIEAATGLRVVTTPEAAIRGLKRALTTGTPA